MAWAGGSSALPSTKLPSLGLSFLICKVRALDLRISKVLSLWFCVSLVGAAKYLLID